MLYLGGHRCNRCKLEFNEDGTLLIPAACSRCRSEEIVWDGDFYDCGRCGRVHFGPFPHEPWTRVAEPEGGYVAHSPGFVPGSPSNARRGDVTAVSG